MAIPLLELQQANKLSACTLSLSLGVASNPNFLEQFLQFNAQLAQMDYAILSFHQEAYVWHYDQQTLKAIDNTILDQYRPMECFSENVVDDQHPKYVDLLKFIQLFQPQAQCAIALKLYYSDQTPLGYVVLYDVKMQKLTEQQQQLLKTYQCNFIQQIELKHRYDELNLLYEQETALNFSKTKFFSIISHDLRAPFHGLLGFSEILAKERETLDESSIQNISDYLYETAQSTYNLLENLLSWAMAENGRFVCRPVHFQLKQVSQIAVKTLTGLALKKNIQLIDHVDGDLQIYADPNMITSVIQNLLANALKFTHTDGTGRVSIQAGVQGNYALITVQDTGLGMSQEQQQSLFQPHLRMSVTGTAGEQGIGLGLTLCKRFVDLNHGSIQVSSQQGKGTMVQIKLPMTVEQVTRAVELHKSEAKFV